MRQFVCTECGATVEMTDARQKYCLDCRVKVMRRQQLESQRKRRVKKKTRDELHTLDNPLMMAMCLSCTRDRCTGECKAVLQLGTRRKRRAENGAG